MGNRGLRGAGNGRVGSPIPAPTGRPLPLPRAVPCGTPRPQPPSTPTGRPLPRLLRALTGRSLCFYRIRISPNPPEKEFSKLLCSDKRTKSSWKGLKGTRGVAACSGAAGSSQQHSARCGALQGLGSEGTAPGVLVRLFRAGNTWGTSL